MSNNGCTGCLVIFAAFVLLVTVFTLIWGFLVYLGWNEVIVGVLEISDKTITYWQAVAVGLVFSVVSNMLKRM